MMRWIIIILALVALGVMGYYYIYSPAEAPQAGTEAKETLPVGESADLEAELEATSVEGLDAELGDIERELAQ